MLAAVDHLRDRGVAEVSWLPHDDPAVPLRMREDLPYSVVLDYPMAGHLLVQNSPADRVPSHGTELFAGARAIDLVPVDARGRSAPFGPLSVVRSEDPARFPGFGRPVHAVVDGIVVAARDDLPDHRAQRGLPSVTYALTQGRRAAQGWQAMAGNHLLIQQRPGVVVAVCHLQQGSLRVGVGQRVRAGQRIGSCGNSGNSTEPHVHLQAMDGRDPMTANALPITFPGGLPCNGTVVDGRPAG
ncbi:M23 family metallopeptidase [Naumannella halotolerans]|uniref:Murein DD-endopeptidase MepM/ murein hydrolase activator NlpD n=1 Tax=Naumannella halotolerans TaxID=993414 RepID=A0A4R7J6V6_9ACTN|nr:M23 family metallopeptidase [Naumannella halotolerans]TDT33141.1 murein DD-endopeptidase MepM/ murein hydrolase activator NlpD [Naumannella halotolerans]